ncbi:hypothetical protein RBB75_09925 [Tunturibacter empetritectus]|uniref:Uncharacterized protein n=1 Tax=Tunturiibacter empetritectus TaxID=3069691 RepID=A0AAU7ZIH2_9BACT
MKKAAVTLLQFVLFLLVFVIGSFAHPFNLQWGLTVTTPAVTRYFVADGLVLIFLLYALILVIEALTKRLRSYAPWTTVALILATVLGLMIKIGFVTRSAY